MSRRRPRPSKERPPEVEISASARAERVRFDEKPRGGGVRFRGGADSGTATERENLPDNVDAGRTYSYVTIRWRGAAWVDHHRS